MLLNKCYARSFSRNMLSSTPYFKIQALQCWCIESTGNEIQFQSLQHQRQEKDQLRDTSAKVCLTRQLGCNGIEALHFRSSTWSHHGNADGTLQFFSFFFFQFETLLSENFARERWFFWKPFHLYLGKSFSRTAMLSQFFVILSPLLTEIIPSSTEPG